MQTVLSFDTGSFASYFFAGAFSDLTSLTLLSLNQNDLVSLEDGIFSSLSSLTELRIRDNLLATIQRDIFNVSNRPSNLNSFQFYGSNPLVRLLWRHLHILNVLGMQMWCCLHMQISHVPHNTWLINKQITSHTLHSSHTLHTSMICLLISHVVYGTWLLCICKQDLIFILRTFSTCRCSIDM